MRMHSPVPVVAPSNRGKGHGQTRVSPKIRRTPQVAPKLISAVDNPSAEKNLKMAAFKIAILFAALLGVASASRLELNGLTQVRDQAQQKRIYHHLSMAMRITK